MVSLHSEAEWANNNLFVSLLCIEANNPNLADVFAFHILAMKATAQLWSKCQFFS